MRLALFGAADLLTQTGKIVPLWNLQVQQNPLQTLSHIFHMLLLAPSLLSNVGKLLGLFPPWCLQLNKGLKGGKQDSLGWERQGHKAGRHNRTGSVLASMEWWRGVFQVCSWGSLGTAWQVSGRMQAKQSRSSSVMEFSGLHYLVHLTHMCICTHTSTIEGREESSKGHWKANQVLGSAGIHHTMNRTRCQPQC